MRSDAAARRGITLIEIIVAVTIASTIGIVASTMLKISLDCKDRRNETLNVNVSGREAIDMITRLVNKATDMLPGGFGQRNLNNFQGPNPNRGIYFFADLNDDAVLEWVWIWTDSTRTSEETVWPYDRRLPLKVAAFQIEPNGAGMVPNWTDVNDWFYQHVNHNTDWGTWPDNAFKAHLVVAENAALQFFVEQVPAAGPKRLTIRGGFYADRGGVDPGWALVQPGAATVYSQRPSWTVNTVITPRNLATTRRPLGAGWTNWNGPPGSNNRQTVLRSEINYQAQANGNPRLNERLYR